MQRSLIFGDNTINNSYWVDVSAKIVSFVAENALPGFNFKSYKFHYFTSVSKMSDQGYFNDILPAYVPGLYSSTAPNAMLSLANLPRPSALSVQRQKSCLCFAPILIYRYQ
jgi:hypothetical protein